MPNITIFDWLRDYNDLRVKLLDMMLIAGRHLDRADELLRQFRCEEYAFRSDLTLLSYEHRLNRLGVQINAALEQPGDAAITLCEVLQREVATHRIAKLGRKNEQVDRTLMAVRLLRWLSQPLFKAEAFAEMAHAYRREVAFIDWARESISRGEDAPKLAQAYQRLNTAVAARREEFNQTFAAALIEWTATGSTANDIWGVEDVLARCLVKVAEAGNRLLLIVLDGLSWAVVYELMEEIHRDRWSEATLDTSGLPPTPVIATVPSVTAYSRMS